MKGIYLFIVSVFLSPLLILGAVYSFICFLLTFNIKKMFQKLGSYCMAIAISIDQLGNVVMSELFNHILIKDVYVINKFYDKITDSIITTKLYSEFKHLFGNEDETISSVLGKNESLGTLRLPGKILNAILNLLEKNHSLKSIEADETHE